MARYAILNRKLSFSPAVLLTGLVLSLNGWSGAAQSAPTAYTKAPESNLHKSRLEVDHVEKNTIYFKATDAGAPAPPPLKTDLFEIEPLGVIEGESTPYVLFSARTCENCHQEAALFAMKTNGQSPSSFVIPGRIVDPKSRTVVYDSRAFFGHCLSSHAGDVYVVYQKERIDRRNRLQPSVFVAEATSRFMNEKLYDTGMPSLSDTLRLVKGKQCREVEGRNRMMSRTPPDIKVHHEDDEDDGDDEDEPSSTNEKSPAS